MYKIRTIDVWDTLLRRDCHPECIKLATSQHIFLGWNDKIKPEFRSSWLVYNERIKAERELAEQAEACGNDGEYEITQVITRCLNTIFLDTVSSDLPAQLAEFELNVEIERSTADTEIHRFLDSYSAEKSLFLSDFYMGAEMLRRLLSSKGLESLVPEGISSCDVGMNKRSGQIFRHIHSVHAIAPEEHVHIGDNEWSDVSSPRSLGVNALHYLPQTEHAERVARERLFLSREALFEHIHAQCVRLAGVQDDKLSSKQATAARSLGIQATPLFVGFVIWIAEQALIQKLDRVYFCTREGEFFQKVFRTVFPQGQFFGHKLPSIDILEVSRLSTFAASMKDVSIEEMTRIWSLFKVQSVSGLFVTLGLNIESFSGLLETIGLSKDDIVVDPENSLELRRLFDAPAFTEAAKSSLALHASLLKRYLEQSGVHEANRVGIVDIGWRGTIQDNISLLASDVHFHGMYLGLRRFINAQPSNTSKAAYVKDENTTLAPNSLFTNFSAMEMICNSPRGSVVGYTLDGEQVKAVRHIDQRENETFYEFIKPLQDSVLDAARQWSSYLDRYAVSSSDLHPLADHIWNMMRKDPNDSLLDVYFRTPQQDIFGYGDILQRSQYPSLGTIILSPIFSSRRRKLIEFIRRVQWSEAIKKSKDIGSLHRSLLLLTFWAANFIRIFRAKKSLIRRSRNGQQ
jgi:FMN phosphatase YigB (HAD superfamily)